MGIEFGYMECIRKNVWKAIMYIFIYVSSQK